MRKIIVFNIFNKNTEMKRKYQLELDWRYICIFGNNPYRLRWRSGTADQEVRGSNFEAEINFFHY